MRAQPTLGVPPQFLCREPAHALNKRAFDLTQVQCRVQRSADIVKDVGAIDLIFAGQRIDADFEQDAP